MTSGQLVENAAELALLLQRWENGDVSDDEVLAAIKLFDGLTDEQQKLLRSRNAKTISRLEIAASKIRMNRKASPPMQSFNVEGGRIRTISQEEEDQQLISELAEMDDAIEFGRQRKQIAQALGVRVDDVEAAVKAKRKKAAEQEEKEKAQRQIVERIPWDSAVDGEALIDELIGDCKRYVSIRDVFAVITGFWTLHTYLIEHVYWTPRLAIRAPDQGCGKSTLVSWLATVVQRPRSSVNVSPASVYRCIEGREPTLLLDEADKSVLLNKPLQGILNGGHMRGASVDRYDLAIGDNRAFPIFCPCAIALNGSLTSQLQSRSLSIHLQRRMPDEPVDFLRADRINDDIARRCARWAKDNEVNFKSADPEVPGEIYNRGANNWLALFGIADVIGGSWPARLRQIAVSITREEAGEDVSPNTQILLDIYEITEGLKWIATADLVAELRERDHQIKGMGLMLKLKPYGIRPVQIYNGTTGKGERGYWVKDFAETFKRYLPSLPSLPSAEGVSGGDDIPPGGTLETGETGETGDTVRYLKLGKDIRRTWEGRTEDGQEAGPNRDLGGGGSQGAVLLHKRKRRISLESAFHADFRQAAIRHPGATCAVPVQHLPTVLRPKGVSNKIAASRLASQKAVIRSDQN
jgi:hypothetical protein